MTVVLRSVSSTLPDKGLKICLIMKVSTATEREGNRWSEHGEEWTEWELGTTGKYALNLNLTKQPGRTTN